jgi:hypothetical protein
MLKKFLTKFKTDSADAVLVTVILAMPGIMIAAGFAADMSKSAYVSSTYSSMAQRSSETAVSTINARGSLDNDSVRKFVSEFRTQAKVSKYHTDETLQAETSSVCSTRNIRGVERKLPYIEVRLGTARGANDEGTTTIWNVPADKEVVDKVLNPKIKYKVISADVYTGSPNFILGMFGQPCQYLKSPVSAISFGDNADLK